MPERDATIESLPVAIEVVKAMQAQGLDWGRAIARLAVGRWPRLSRRRWPRRSIAGWRVGSRGRCGSPQRLLPPLAVDRTLRHRAYMRASPSRGVWFLRRWRLRFLIRRLGRFRAGPIRNGSIFCRADVRLAHQLISGSSMTACHNPAFTTQTIEETGSHFLPASRRAPIVSSTSRRPVFAADRPEAR